MKWQSAHHFMQRLRKRGYQNIGGGFFSAVFARPGSTKVIKVCRSIDGWPLYIQWAAERGELGKRAPLVTSLKVIASAERDGVGNARHFYVAVMERLVCTLDAALQPRAPYSDMIRDAADRCGDEWRFDHAKHGVWGDYVREMHRTLRGSLDCHTGNWMFRACGELVLIDPLSTEGVASSSVRRLKSTAPRRVRDDSAWLLPC